MDPEILPDSVVPSHYHISLTDVCLAPPWTYRGVVKINVKAVKTVQNVILNAVRLDIDQASIESLDGKVLLETSKVEYDTKLQRASLLFPKNLPLSNVVISMIFRGTITDELCGFYRSKYKSEGSPPEETPSHDGYSYMYSTQFEACDARKAFPCFDEPNLKATFDIDIEIPSTLTALSNMPVKSSKAGGKEGLKVVSFETTPKMSTYLAAWAIGDFDYVESFTEREYNGAKIPVRVYCTRGLKEKGQYALEHAGPTLDYFSDVFGIDYPLPKADLLAVHDFALGAMENWGLVTYRATQVLFDENESDPYYRNRIAYVVAHELAHQWYGNLVTFAWWNDIWLNEGFATWAGWLAVAHHHPEWDIWAQFVTGAMALAYRLDSVRASHPVEIRVNNALEIDQAFDHISYYKGSSVIRMLSNFLGLESFLEGVSLYLSKHAYGNTNTDDLWASLTSASGKDVKTFMDPWIRKIGFPVLTVAEEPGQISVQQRRFLSTGDVKPEDDETTWWLPLGFQGEASTADLQSSLTSKEDTIRGVGGDFYKLNKDHSGLYRTNYPPERLMKLGQSRKLLSSPDRVGLISDATALAVSGEGTTTSLLSLLEHFRDETNYHVWYQIARSLAKVASVCSSNPRLENGFRKFRLNLVAPTAEALGWEDKPSDPYLTIRLRTLMLHAAGSTGHSPTLSTARSRFARWRSGDTSAVPGRFRNVIFPLVVAEGGKDEYEALKQEYLQTTTINGRDTALSAMGRTKDPALARDMLDFATSEQVRTQDAHHAPGTIGGYRATKRVGWEYIKGNWDRIYARLGSNKILLDRFIRPALTRLSDREAEKEIEEFFGREEMKEQTGGIERTLQIAGDYIRGNVAYREREESRVEEWLGVNGYL